MSLEVNTCILCGKTDVQEVYPASPNIEVNDPFPYYQHTTPGHFKVFRCKACGLVRSEFRDDPETRSHIYDQLKETVLKPEESNRIQTFRRRARWISKKMITGSTLLDIGCHTGLFIGEIMRFGWQATGIDVSEWAILEARQHAPWAVFQATEVEKAIFPAGSFDVITLWDLLEHVNDPRAVLARITPWLIPGGLLYFNLPNIDSLESQIFGSNWPLLLREHIWYFSPVTLGRLLNEAGYEVIAIQSNKARFSLGSTGQRLIKYEGWVKGLGTILSMPILNKLAFWLTTGEMEVVARLKTVPLD